MLNLSAGIIVICVNLPFLCKMLVYLFSGQIAAVFLEINLLLAIHLFLSFKEIPLSHFFVRVGHIFLVGIYSKLVFCFFAFE